MKASIAGIALVGSLIAGQHAPERHDVSQKPEVSHLAPSALAIADHRAAVAGIIQSDVASDSDEGKFQHAIFYPKKNETISDGMLQVEAASGPNGSESRPMSALREYVSLFKMELLYLQFNPELLASCGKNNPDREVMRSMAIKLVQDIVNTAPTNPDDMNSEAHESARNRLFQIRKRLYVGGEMGYVSAQEWGYKELMRQKKIAPKTQGKNQI